VSGFGLMAVCLAAAGVYGVLTFMVGQRTREIGLRMALGATKGAILRMVIGEGALLAAIGMGLGVGAAAAMARLINSMLFQVKPDDPLTILAGLASLSALTFAACYLPASRAAGIDPFRTLRVD